MSSSDSSPSPRRGGSSGTYPHLTTRGETWPSTAGLTARLNVPVKTLAVWAIPGRGLRHARMGRYRLGDVHALEDQPFVSGGDSLIPDETHSDIGVVHYASE